MVDYELRDIMVDWGWVYGELWLDFDELRDIMVNLGEILVNYGYILVN